MKLCPQCEFIYEDDQASCDMDGEALVFEPRLGVLISTSPAVVGAGPRRSRLRIIVAPVVAGVVLLILLSLAYYATSAPLAPNFASRGRKAQVPAANLQQQIAPSAAVSGDPAITKSSTSANTETDSEPELIGGDASTGKSTTESGRNQVVPKTTDKTIKTLDPRLSIPKGVPPLPRLTPLPRLAPPTQLPAVKPETKLPVNKSSQKQGSINQNLTAPNQKAMVVEVKPVGDNENKPSRVKSFLKKTGRFLQRPFKS